MNDSIKEAVLALLKTGTPYTKQHLSEKLSVHLRTIDRALVKLKEQYPIEETRDHKDKNRKWLSLPSTSANQNASRFTDDEKEALAAALEAAQALLAYTHYDPHLKTVFDKLIEGGDLPWGEKDTQQNWYFEKTHATPPDKQVFKTIMKAIWTAKTLKVVYESADRRKKEARQLVPYTLAFVEGDWTVFAYCPRHQEVRDFRVARISNATLLPTELDPSHLRPTNFDPHEFYDDRTNGLGSELKTPLYVKFRVAYPTAYWFKEKCWHSSQKNGQEDQNGLWVEMWVGNWKGIIGLLKRFAGDIYVAHPPELQAALKAEAEKMARQYDL